MCYTMRYDELNPLAEDHESESNLLIEDHESESNLLIEDHESESNLLADGCVLRTMSPNRTFTHDMTLVVRRLGWTIG